MSRRSYHDFSQSHEKRLSKYRVTDQDVYTYVLRVAYLSYLLQPKPANPDGSYSYSSESREHHSRLSTTLSNSILSLGDLFKDARDGSRSVKFPEKLVKVLEQKLQMIAMGQDPGYTDQLVRRTMAKFYGHFMDSSFKRQMKENRKIEELILMFATDATGVLKKEPTLAGDGWKVELNRQIAQFVRILRECLRNVSGVSPELLQRLETYTAKLAPSQASSDSGYESSSTSRDRDSWTVLGHNVNDMALVKTVAALFKIPESDILSEVDQVRGICTEKAALTDLKSCLKNISAGMPFPGNREDFESDSAWQYWKHQETTQIQQLMLVMIQLNPELAKSAPSQFVPAQSARPGSVYSPSFDRSPALASRSPSLSGRRSMYGALDIDNNGMAEELDADDEVPVGNNFTYIPPNPRKYYKRLLEIALVADLEVMLSPEVDDNDEVSLGILSGPHIELINECALRWRIGHPYRAACFLELVKQFYERSEVPLECIPEALQTVQKVKADTPFDKWPINDLNYITTIYSQLYRGFLSNIYHAMDGIPNLKMSDIGPYLEVMEDLQSSGLLDHSDTGVSAQLSDIQERVKQVATQAYQLKLQELQSAPGVNRALPLLLMTDEVEKWAKLLDKRFPQPILGQIDLVSLVVEVQVPLFVSDLEGAKKRLFESSMNGPTPDVPIQDIFALYRRTKTLLSMFQAFVPEGDTRLDIVGYFEPYVHQWLVNTDNKTAQWVQAAIAADKFEAEGPEGHSSSIVDLFDSLRSPIGFLEELEWSDLYQEARFYTSLAKTISRAVEQYCRKIEEMFMAEMYPRPADYLQPQKSSAWLEKARQLASQSEKKVEPFNFQPESCVKLNNVEAARKLLDNLYNQMNADKLAEVLDTYAPPPVPDKVEKQKFLFTVKIVLAEGLVPTDNSPSSRLDSFITLSDEAGNRVAKTRTIYETNGPRWEESFDISVEKALWLMVSVRDRALVGKHDTVGRAYLCLDPKRFGDLLTHDLWMDLDTQGRVLIRVSMEGEKDDIQFYFGRAFRSLKRSESDMVRIFIDKMVPFIRQNLSRPVLKTLIKASSMGIDVNKALGNVTALYRSALSSSSNEVQIPLPSDEKPRKRPEELTDVEIEQAIAPLFDYFDANLQILNTYLSELMKEKVMTKTWKEILITIEGLLVPPLSAIDTDMKPLSDKEADIVLKWLKFLRDYFFAGGEGLPLETLHNPKHEDIVSIRYYYDWHTDALMEECVRKMQETLRASPTMKRVKSVYQHKNLGTIKERKKEKKEEKVKETNGGEVIMRILRMRPGTSDFIAQQLQIMEAMKKEQEARATELAKRKLSRPSQRRKEAPPPVPALPPLNEGLR